MAGGVAGGVVGGVAGGVVSLIGGGVAAAISLSARPSMLAWVTVACTATSREGNGEGSVVCPVVCPVCAAHAACAACAAATVASTALLASAAPATSVAPTPSVLATSWADVPAPASLDVNAASTAVASGAEGERGGASKSGPAPVRKSARPCRNQPLSPLALTRVGTAVGLAAGACAPGLLLTLVPVQAESAAPTAVAPVELRWSRQAAAPALGRATVVVGVSGLAGAGGGVAEVVVATAAEEDGGVDDATSAGASACTGGGGGVGGG